MKKKKKNYKLPQGINVAKQVPSFNWIYLISHQCEEKKSKLQDMKL